MKYSKITLCLLLTIFTFSLSISTLIAQGNSECEDPDITVTGECGMSFDLCIDYQALPQSGEVDIDVTSNDDLGLFNSCDLELILDDASFMAKHGTVTKINDNGVCKFRYTLTDPYYVGTDTFSYLLNYINNCESAPSDCTGQGKIWTITSNYYGPDNAAVIVHAKEGSSTAPFDTVYNLINGQQFFVNGSGLAQNQTNWTFVFYPNGNLNASPFETADVHTSCSVWIFGIDYGIFRPMTGCVAPKNDRQNCVIYDANSMEYKPNTAAASNQFTVDTTDVIVYILPLGNLPIDFTSIWGRSLDKNNLIAWEIASVVNEEYMFLQYSHDGVSWNDLTKFRNLETGSFEYLHENVANETTYYRFKMISTEGNESFSRAINIHNENIKSDDVNIFPNPSSDDINFTSEGPIAYIELYDLSGQLIVRKQIGRNYTSLSKEELGLSEGVYIAAVHLENNNRILRKLTLL